MNGTRVMANVPYLSSIKLLYQMMRSEIYFERHEETDYMTRIVHSQPEKERKND